MDELQWAPQAHTVACSLHPRSIGMRMSRIKVRKPVGWDKGSLTTKANAACASIAQECLPFLLFSPSFYNWARCHTVWDIPLVSWGHLSRLCPLSTCSQRTTHVVGQHEKQKCFDAVQALPSNSKKKTTNQTMHCSHCFDHKSETYHHGKVIPHRNVCYSDALKRDCLLKCWCQ